MNPEERIAYGDIGRKGLWENNTALVQLLGLCPLLAVSNTLVNAVSLSLATVLVMALASGAVAAQVLWTGEERAMADGGASSRSMQSDADLDPPIELLNQAAFSRMHGGSYTRPRLSLRLCPLAVPSGGAAFAAACCSSLLWPHRCTRLT